MFRGIIQGTMKTQTSDQFNSAFESDVNRHPNLIYTMYLKTLTTPQQMNSDTTKIRKSILP